MLSDSDAHHYLSLGTEIARRAASALSPEEDKQVTTDLVRDVKIKADRKLHLFIEEELRKRSPFPIVSEEGIKKALDETETEPCWIVDPLDGSLNFSRHIPLCGISIALWQQGEPLAGVIYDFTHKELFTALVGSGAWLNDRPIHVGGIREKSDAVLCTGFPVGTDFSENRLTQFVREMRVYKKVRLLGSAALSLAYVASGRADVYRENDIALWDVAAGLALVKGAGGQIRCRGTDTRERVIVKAANAFLL